MSDSDRIYSDFKYRTCPYRLQIEQRQCECHCTRCNLRTRQTQVANMLQMSNSSIRNAAKCDCVSCERQRGPRRIRHSRKRRAATDAPVNRNQSSCTPAVLGRLRRSLYSTSLKVKDLAQTITKNSNRMEEDCDVTPSEEIEVSEVRDLRPSTQSLRSYYHVEGSRPSNQSPSRLEQPKQFDEKTLQAQTRKAKLRGRVAHSGTRKTLQKYRTKLEQSEQSDSPSEKKLHVLTKKAKLHGKVSHSGTRKTLHKRHTKLEQPEENDSPTEKRLHLPIKKGKLHGRVAHSGTKKTLQMHHTKLEQPEESDSPAEERLHVPIKKAKLHSGTRKTLQMHCTKLEHPEESDSPAEKRLHVTTKKAELHGRVAHSRTTKLLPKCHARHPGNRRKLLTIEHLHNAISLYCKTQSLQKRRSVTSRKPAKAKTLSCKRRHVQKRSSSAAKQRNNPKTGHNENRPMASTACQHGDVEDNDATQHIIQRPPASCAHESEPPSGIYDVREVAPNQPSTSQVNDRVPSCAYGHDMHCTQNTGQCVQCRFQPHSCCACCHGQYEMWHALTSGTAPQSVQNNSAPCPPRKRPHTVKTANQHKKKRPNAVSHTSKRLKLESSFSTDEPEDSLLCRIICLHDPLIDRITPKAVAAAKLAGLGPAAPRNQPISIPLSLGGEDFKEFIWGLFPNLQRRPFTLLISDVQRQLNELTVRAITPMDIRNWIGDSILYIRPRRTIIKENEENPWSTQPGPSGAVPVFRPHTAPTLTTPRARAEPCTPPRIPVPVMQPPVAADRELQQLAQPAMAPKVRATLPPCVPLAMPQMRVPDVPSPSARLQCSVSAPQVRFAMSSPNTTHAAVSSAPARPPLRSPCDSDSSYGLPARSPPMPTPLPQLFAQSPPLTPAAVSQSTVEVPSLDAEQTRSSMSGNVSSWADESADSLLLRPMSALSRLNGMLTLRPYSPPSILFGPLPWFMLPSVWDGLSPPPTLPQQMIDSPQMTRSSSMPRLRCTEVSQDTGPTEQSLHLCSDHPFACITEDNATRSRMPASSLLQSRSPPRASRSRSCSPSRSRSPQPRRPVVVGSSSLSQSVMMGQSSPAQPGPGPFVRCSPSKCVSRVCPRCGKTLSSQAGAEPPSVGECLSCQQDSEYLQSLSVDAAKRCVREQKQTEAVERNAMPAAVQTQRSSQLSPRPTDGFLVKVKFPDHTVRMRTFNRTDNVEHLVNFIGCHPRATPSYIIVVPGVNMCLHSLTVNMMQTLSDINITGPTLLHVFWNTADDSLDSSRHLSASTT